MTVNSHGYNYIVAWGDYMGSHAGYIQDQCDLALQEKAPKNAIYAKHGADGHKPEDGWETTDGIMNPRAREALGLDPLKVPDTTGDVDADSGMRLLHFTVVMHPDGAATAAGIADVITGEAGVISVFGLHNDGFGHLLRDKKPLAGAAEFSQYK